MRNKLVRRLASQRVARIPESGDASGPDAVEAQLSRFARVRRAA